MSATGLEDEIVLPYQYGTFQHHNSGTPLWQRVRNRAHILFSVDRTPHEMVLVFEALQDANLRIAALESAIVRLVDNAS